MRTAQRALDAALGAVYPARCLGCGVVGAALCAACLAGLPRLQPPFCPRCGRSLPVAITCGNCLQLPLRLEGVRSALAYEGLARRAVQRLKYENDQALAIPLAAVLLERCQAEGFAPEVVVPVPLHAARQRRRGYNQSALLARRLALALDADYDDHTLHRHMPTRPQVGLGARERRQNVQGAFSCAGRALDGRRVLLVDDVFTTGATVDACAVALRRSGVRAVWAVTATLDVLG